jgi:hypothetical protein
VQWWSHGDDDWSRGTRRGERNIRHAPRPATAAALRPGTLYPGLEDPGKVCLQAHQEKEAEHEMQNERGQDTQPRTAPGRKQERGRYGRPQGHLDG